MLDFYNNLNKIYASLQKMTLLYFIFFFCFRLNSLNDNIFLSVCIKDIFRTALQSFGRENNKKIKIKVDGQHGVYSAQCVFVFIELIF